jgi:hypothetical protein
MVYQRAKQKIKEAETTLGIAIWGVRLAGLAVIGWLLPWLLTLVDSLNISQWYMKYFVVGLAVIGSYQIIVFIGAIAAVFAWVAVESR